MFVIYWLLEVWNIVASIGRYTCRRWENVTVDDSLLPSRPYHSPEFFLILPLCEVIVAIVEATQPGGIDAALAICGGYVGVHQLCLHASNCMHIIYIQSIYVHTLHLQNGSTILYQVLYGGTSATPACIQWYQRHQTYKHVHHMYMCLY